MDIPQKMTVKSVGGWLLASALLVTAACSGAAESGEGAETCFRNSDCSDRAASCVEGVCRTECGDDRDCSEGETCEESFCVSPTETCRTDADCRYGYRCALGYCEEIDDFCLEHTDCPETGLCDMETERCGSVFSDGRCSEDADCFEGEQCLNASCTLVNPITPPDEPECTRASDCSGGEVCLNGYCEPECVDSRDCSTGYSCSGGRCIADDPGNPDPPDDPPQPTNPYSGTFQLSSTTPIQRCNELTSIEYDARLVNTTQDDAAYTFNFPTSTYHGYVQNGLFEVSWSGFQAVHPYCGELNSSNTYTGSFSGDDFFSGQLRTDLYFQVAECNCVLIYDIVGTRIR